MKQLYSQYTSFFLSFLGCILGVFLVICHQGKTDTILFEIAEYTQSLSIWFFIVCMIPVISHDPVDTLINSLSFFPSFVLTYYVFQYLIGSYIDTADSVIFWLITSLLCSLYAMMIKGTEKRKFWYPLFLSFAYAYIFQEIIYIFTTTSLKWYMFIPCVLLLLLIKIHRKQTEITRVLLIGLALTLVKYLLYYIV